MPYQIIDAKDAPAPSANPSAAAAEAVGIIKQLKRLKVARVEPEGLGTVRGLRVNLARAAKRADSGLQTWDVDGVLFVKLAN